MRIAVTGATGNLGTAVVRRLVADGHDVLGLARRVEDIPPGTEGAVTTYRSIDLSRPASQADLTDAFAGADAVVHLAWGFQPSHDQGYLEALGVGGTRRVLAAVEAAGVPHLVHTSSLGPYAPGRDDAAVDESYPTDGVPTSIYSRHKVAAERLLDDHEHEHPDTTVTRLRPGIVGQLDAGRARAELGWTPAYDGRAVLREVLTGMRETRSRATPVLRPRGVRDALARAWHAGPVSSRPRP